MMKVTLIRQDRNNLKHMRTLTIDNLIERIKYDTKQQTIDELRRFIGMDSCEQHDQFWNMHRLPRIYPAAELGKNRDGGYSMKRFNGIVLLDVNHLTKKEEVQLVKQRAGCLPTTMAAFTGASGRSVKILIPAVRPNGRLPQNEDEAADFYQRAYCLAANLYDSILPHPVTRRKTGCCLLNAESSASDAYSCRLTQNPTSMPKPNRSSCPTTWREERQARISTTRKRKATTATTSLRQLRTDDRQPGKKRGKSTSAGAHDS